MLARLQPEQLSYRLKYCDPINPPDRKPRWVWSSRYGQWLEWNENTQKDSLTFFTTIDLENMNQPVRSL